MSAFATAPELLLCIRADREVTPGMVARLNSLGSVRDLTADGPRCRCCRGPADGAVGVVRLGSAWLAVVADHDGSVSFYGYRADDAPDLASIRADHVRLSNR